MAGRDRGADATTGRHVCAAAATLGVTETEIAQAVGVRTRPRAAPMRDGHQHSLYWPRMA